MSTMLRHSASVIPGVALPGSCATGLRMASPTQLIRVSMWPNSAMVRATAASAPAAVVASPVRGRQTRPIARTSSATRLTPLGVNPVTATSAPAWAKARAMPLPMPRPAPVSSAFWPEMSNMSRLMATLLLFYAACCRQPTPAGGCGGIMLPQLSGTGQPPGVERLPGPVDISAPLLPFGRHFRWRCRPDINPQSALEAGKGLR